MKMAWMAVAAAGVAVVAGVSVAQEAKPFKNTASVGLTLTDGNSDTMVANGSLVSEGEKEGLGSVRASIEGNYGEQTKDGEKDPTLNNVKAAANAKKTISERWFGSMDGSVLHDQIADIRYRATLGPGVGVYLLKTPKTAFSLEVGPSYLWEKVGDVRDDYLVGRVAERIDHAMSDTAKIWQSAEYLPKTENFSDFLLNAEAGVSAAINTRMDLRMVLQNKHDSTPAEGLERNDLTLITGIGVRL